MFLQYPLKYRQDWAVPAKRGTSIPRSDTGAVYFYVAATEGGTPWLQLSDASSTQIASLTLAEVESSATTNTTVRVKLGSNTSGHVGDNQWFELRIKIADGSYVTARQGKIHVKQS
ncbi:MAG: hypothetical protein JWN86_423 [Planctomycetota bacterium]|nr:hypothetical protein [Planctomycetota bacterium]